MFRSLDRYCRQMLVPVIGEEGQRKLAAARVGLVGCGALGSVIATLLVRAGVGYLRVADRDLVEITNLHRQILYTEEDVRSRTLKPIAAVARLREANGDVTVEPYVGTVDTASMADFAGDLDLLVDGTDNFPTRFAINDYAMDRGIPWVYGGVIRTHGMTMTVVPGQGPCLRCIFRELPPPGTVPTAAQAGVLSTVVAVVASLEATEVMKLVIDPEARNRRLLTVDVWNLAFDAVDILLDPDCPACAGRR